MVNLQLLRVHFLKVDKTLAAILGYEGFPNYLGKAGAAGHLAETLFAYIAETIGADLSSAGTRYPKGFKWNTVFAHIPCGSWRMVITIGRFEVFSGNLPVFQDVVYDRFLRVLP